MFEILDTLGMSRTDGVKKNCRRNSIQRTPELLINELIVNQKLTNYDTFQSIKGKSTFTYERSVRTANAFHVSTKPAIRVTRLGEFSHIWQVFFSLDTFFK
jgi:hypothetical protein